MENPFERYDLDPLGGIAAITQQLKELAEDAKDDAERERIRQAWEELTLHPMQRLRAAVFAHPETRPALGLPPMLPRARAPETALAVDASLLSPKPSLLAVVPADDAGSPALGDDPVLRPTV